MSAPLRDDLWRARDAGRLAMRDQEQWLADQLRDRGLDAIADAVPGTYGGDPSSTDETISSWAPVDLTAALAGEGEPPPSILARADGPCLLYRGRLHSVSAEPEAGKGWLALRATADLLTAGRTVLYIDMEDSPESIVARLRALGVEAERIVAEFVYVRPDEPLTDRTRSDLDAALARRPALVVIDGVTEALTLHGLDLGDNADVAKWLDLLPRPAARSGAAVLLIDHVVKDREMRGRYALGAQHKLAGIDSAYGLEVVEPFGRGRSGLVKVTVAKDRPGHVRQYAEGGQVALMRLGSDAETGAVTVMLDPPDSAGEGGQWRPTLLMERVSRHVEGEPGATRNRIRESVRGKNDYVDTALGILVQEGYVERRPEGKAYRHHSLRPYRQEADRAPEPRPSPDRAPGPVGATGPPGPAPYRGPGPGPGSEDGVANNRGPAGETGE